MVLRSIRRASKRQHLAAGKGHKHLKRRRHELRVVSHHKLSDAERIRWAARTCAKFLHDSKSDVVALYVFAEQSEMADYPFTVARAQLSKDGKGWDGKGRRLVGSGPDTAGVVLVDVVSARDPRSGYPTNWDSHEIAVSEL